MGRTWDEGLGMGGGEDGVPNSGVRGTTGRGPEEGP